MKNTSVDGKGFRSWHLSYLILDTVRLGCKNSNYLDFRKDSCSDRFQETGIPLILVSKSTPLDVEEKLNVSLSILREASKQCPQSVNH